MIAAVSALGSLYLIDLTSAKTPPAADASAITGWMTGPVEDVQRTSGADGSDVLIVSFSEMPARFTISITRFDVQGLDLILEDENCWILVEDGTNESSEWMTVDFDYRACSDRPIRIGLIDASFTEGFGRQYFRTPGLLLRAGVDSGFEWIERDGEIPVAAEPFVSRGATDPVKQDGVTWVVEEAGGLASGLEGDEVYCQTDDPSTGKSGPWHCESTGWHDDDALAGLRDHVTVSLPGAYYNLVQSNWGERRDLLLLIAGALVGLVGAVVFRLVEDATLGRRSRNHA